MPAIQSQEAQEADFRAGPASLADREADFRAGQEGPVDLVVPDGEVPRDNINSQG